MSNDRRPLHERPASDLSDAELRLAVFAAAERRDQLAADDPAGAAVMNDLACVWASEQDNRRALYRAAADALLPPAVGR